MHSTYNVFFLFSLHISLCMQWETYTVRHAIWATGQDRANLSPTRLSKSALQWEETNRCLYSTHVPWASASVLGGFNHHKHDRLVPGPYHQLRLPQSPDGTLLPAHHHSWISQKCFNLNGLNPKISVLSYKCAPPMFSTFSEEHHHWPRHTS